VFVLILNITNHYRARSFYPGGDEARGALERRETATTAVDKFAEEFDKLQTSTMNESAESVNNEREDMSND
jgi:hypothetical protein